MVLDELRTRLIDCIIRAPKATNKDFLPCLEEISNPANPFRFLYSFPASVKGGQSNVKAL
jgi:hypothetical protein